MAARLGLPEQKYQIDNSKFFLWLSVLKMQIPKNPDILFKP